MPNASPTYINPFDPDQTAQISMQLADLVTGEFTFDGLGHELRVRRLSAFIRIYQAVIDLGDLEHTADWDWRIEITHGDGEYLIPADDVEGTSMCDTIELPYEIEPTDYVDGFARWTHLRAYILDWSTDEHTTTWASIPIDDIRRLHCEYL